MHENLPPAKYVRVAIFLLRKNIAGASNGFDGVREAGEASRMAMR